MNNGQVENLLLWRQQKYSTPVRINQYLSSLKKKQNNNQSLEQTNEQANKGKRRTLDFSYKNVKADTV